MDSFISESSCTQLSPLADFINSDSKVTGFKIFLTVKGSRITKGIIVISKRSPSVPGQHGVKLHSQELILCPTRWTVRAEAIDAVIKQYTIIIETLDEVHSTTKDEYGLKAGGIVTALEKFDMFFGLQLGHLLFGAAENTSIVLQRKDISVQEAFSAVNVTTSLFINDQGKTMLSTNSMNQL
ncbi:hypothetical protein EMCRGX_G010140 [Ephydatia muelleri]